MTTTQKIRPILFSTDMVKAILEGRKTQTRRIVKDKLLQENTYQTDEEFMKLTTLSKHRIGDILWVRESFQNAIAFIPDKKIMKKGIVYKADPGMINAAESLGVFWKPSIHMPKTACRLFLKITNLKLERLHDITEADAIAEGVYYEDFWEMYNCYECDDKGHKGGNNLCIDGFYRTAIESFRSLWRKINGEESLKSNPYVWVIEFKKTDKPKNFI